jgi:hypothetical protein
MMAFDKNAHFHEGKKMFRKNTSHPPPGRRKLRPNVEAMVNHKGKLKVRGLFKTMVYAHAMAISINFGRVWRYIVENPAFLVLLNLLRVILPCLFTVHSRNGLRKVIIPDKSCCWLETRQHFRQAA